MIRFGPAGIPLSCKGRTLKDGIEDVHNLGLTAMEVQMVRMNVVERYADDDEIGLSPRDVEGDLIVEIIRDDGAEEIVLSDSGTEIEEEDILITLASGLAQNYDGLAMLGRMAKELDVSLSIHTPYYMDLVSNSELTERCLNSIRWVGLIGNQIGADVVVTHMGLYGGATAEEASRRIVDNLGMVMDYWDKTGLTPRLGLETSGRQGVFGSLDEILGVCEQLGSPIPVVNFAHMHAREGGSLRDVTDFTDVFDRIEEAVDGKFYAHFAGVDHDGGNEKRITPIKKGDLRFEPLADCLVETNPDLTLISSSPLLEHDAMYMKVIYERALTKLVLKEVKKRKKEQEALAMESEVVDDAEEEVPEPPKPSKSSKKAPKKKA